MLATHLKWAKNDDYATPLEAWETILQYIPKKQKLWLPFYLDGGAEHIVEGLGYDVEHHDLDFFEYDIPNALVIDNPPYANKKQVIERLKERGEPFALLLPLHTLERNYLHGDNDLQIIIKKGKFNFVEGSKMSAPYKACWFCWGMSHYLKSDKQFIFV